MPKNLRTYSKVKEQFDSENSCLFVMEREGAQQAFNDYRLKSLPTNNPHPRNTPDFFMWRYGYDLFDRFAKRFDSALSDWSANMRRIQGDDLNV